MTLEEKLARALAASYILGRNNNFSTVDELWPSWVNEAQRVLENHVTFSHEPEDVLRQPIPAYFSTLSVGTPTVITTPGLNPNIPQ